MGKPAGDHFARDLFQQRAAASGDFRPFAAQRAREALKTGIGREALQENQLCARLAGGACSGEGGPVARRHGGGREAFCEQNGLGVAAGGRNEGGGDAGRREGRLQRLGRSGLCQRDLYWRGDGQPSGGRDRFPAGGAHLAGVGWQDGFRRRGTGGGGSRPAIPQAKKSAIFRMVRSSAMSSGSTSGSEGYRSRRAERISTCLMESTPSSPSRSMSSSSISSG